MTAADDFDAFYKDARARLLLQTYALTGDLPASRSAVRDSFVTAWHHWRKVDRTGDPEGWVRPHAWQHAQRRHTARIWHRDKSLDPEARATLEALGKLPVAQRKLLLLTHLAAGSLDELSREVGLPRPEAERQLQSATARFAVLRDVPSTGIRRLFEPLRAQVEEARWPRATILRRAGTARRRTHTLVGVVAAVGALVASGAVVTDVAGVRPTLAGESVADPADGSGGTPDGAPGDEQPDAPDPLEEFSGDQLLTTADVARQVPGRRWSTTGTSDNTEGDGLVVPCQQTRFADPRGLATLVRSFETGSRPRRTVVQTVELSRDDRRATRAFDMVLAWYAGCAESRVQLLSTWNPDGLGDEARVLVLRSWAEPKETWVVGVARSGHFTTTTFTQVPGTAAGVPASVGLLTRAVTGLCGQPDAGACPRRVRVQPAQPVPVGPAPGMLVEVDLPPVTGVSRPWVGTQPRRANDNDASTRCDNADFSGRPMSHNITRTFVIPGADRLPAQFGITETVGTLPLPRARAFVADIRRRMEACPDDDLATDVSRTAHVATPTRDLSVWDIRTEISDDQTVSYRMGIVRNGTAVAQIGFVPHQEVTLAPGAFLSLVQRAVARLAAMPAPD